MDGSAGILDRAPPKAFAASAPTSIAPLRVALVLLAIVALGAVLGPLVAPLDPLAQDLALRGVPPSAEHWLGTDQLGRDILSRLLTGARITMLVALGAAAVAVLAGAGLGLLALALGPVPAAMVFALFDLLRALPTVLLGLTLMVALGTGVAPVTLAVGLTFAPTMAAIARAAWLRERAAPYVEAAIACGTAPLVLLRRHIAPNLAGAIITQAAIILPRAVTTESVLSFLGLGVPPETPSWGRMIAGGLPFVERAPWGVLAPVLGLALVTCVLALAGDRLRRAADPLRVTGVMRAVAPLLRQLLTAVAIVALVFVLMRIVPGDVVDVLGIEGDLTEAEQQALREELGLDRGWIGQFGLWVGAAVQGDLGASLRFNQPVAGMIAYALPHTLTLAALALGLGLIVGVGSACLAAIRPRGVWPWIVQALNAWSIALPTFCVGLAGILVLSIWLRLLPVRGQLVVPVLVLGIDIAGQIAKPLLEELREIQATAFIRTAVAKGLSPTAIVLGHVLPNAAGVLAATAGLVLGGLVGGALTMEVLFGLPGLGMLAFQAISGRDWTVLQSVIVILALGVVAANLLADLAHRLADPRVR